ncbi:MAG: hypothetical protein IGS03_17455 [Candidatus Sericytochromatia bacterium]|nr:hypothetical protein [Candidatus Sericytochromatia bacterium]
MNTLMNSCLLSLLLQLSGPGLSPLREQLLATHPGLPQHNHSLVQEMKALEAHTSAPPESALSFDPHGFGHLQLGTRSWQAGHFSTPTLAELKARLPRPAEPGALRFSVLRGQDPLTDIGALQAHSRSGTLFQVASQFNGLEAPGPQLVRVADYFQDPTQGPRAAISAFAGVLLRHYAAPAPDGSHFRQSATQQLNFLADALPDAIGQVEQGYLTARQIPAPQAAAQALEAHFDQIRIGLHANIEVGLGYNWLGRVPEGKVIHQVLTSTLAAGAYSPDIDSAAPEWQAVMRPLLRAAYLGTLLGALSLDAEQVVLTPIGGGVFGNPHPLIWKSLLWALDQAQAYVPPNKSLTVVLNARDFGQGLAEATFETATAQHQGNVRWLP